MIWQKKSDRVSSQATPASNCAVVGTYLKPEFTAKVAGRRINPWMFTGISLGVLGLLAVAAPGFAQETGIATAGEAVVAEAAAGAEEVSAYDAFMMTPESIRFMVNNLWILIAAVLVCMMHLGFATLESGLCQSKNTTNILFKNTFIVSMGLITYYLIGFNTMYPGDSWIIKGFLSLNGPLMTPGADDIAATMTSEYNPGYTIWSDFIFQAMFAATAATIVSGAVAERVKLPGFMVFVTLLVAFAYPIAGAWKWGGGFLAEMGFMDFAGSSIVHAFGGFAALACVLVLGPRKGKYGKNKRINAIPPHSMPLATIGVFLLLLGWFGFNGGSVLSADPQLVSYVFVTTALAAAAGCLGSIACAWTVFKTPDLSMALNGILAGLVGITAGADVIPVPFAILVGFFAGVLVVFAITTLDKVGIDDPVGAISVHGVCGVFGTLAVTFGGANIITQLIGTLCYAAFAFTFSFIVFTAIKMTLGVRVSEEEEYEGLDIGEHKQEAYIVGERMNSISIPKV